MTKRERLPSKPIPIARSIAWKPLDDSYHMLASMLAESGHNYVLLATQKFLAAAEGHAAASAAPGGPSPFAVMFGRLYRCSKSELRYAVIDELKPPPPAVLSDAGRPDVQKLRQFVHDEGQKGDRRIVGWLAALDEAAPRLPLPAERLQAECFPESWQSALVVVPSLAYSSGGFYRYSVRAQRTCQVPFYELIEGTAPKRGERKRTVIEWCNYVTPEPVLRPGVPEAPPSNGSGTNGGSPFKPIGEMFSRVRGRVGGDRGVP